MKRAVFSLVLCLFVLCGCSNKTVSPVTKGISFNAKVTYYNEEYGCQCYVDKEGKGEITVTSPEELEGLKLVLNDLEITAEYKGISYTPKTDSLAVGNVAITLYRIIGGISDEEKLEVEDGENCTLEGSYQKNKYIFTFSPAGLPIKLEIPNENIIAEFSGVTIIK